MGYLPIFLDVTGRRCIVVGGGEVATRKVEGLLEADARVTVVSPRLTDRLDTMHKQGVIEHIARPYRRGDIAGSVLVYAAAGDSTLNQVLADEVRELDILLNVADVPELCDFIVP